MSRQSAQRFGGTRWVFAYGSLMWNPGFAFQNSAPARLDGHHRRLCVYSHHYRGQPERPGLVFGLDRGGACHGLAYEVAAQNWDGTLAYLRERELVSMVYREVELTISIGSHGDAVSALTYVVNQQHPQYAGVLTEDDMVRLVSQGHGEAGSCADYLRNSLAAFDRLGIGEPELQRILERLGQGPPAK